jgi:phosphosulfolactate synthase
LSVLPIASREGKPREKGLTILCDTFPPLDRAAFEEAAEYIDYAKIGLSLPLIIERSRLAERVRRYHDLGIRVMSGGTLMEVAHKKGIVQPALDLLRSAGFDTVELSDSVVPIPKENKRSMLDKIAALSMEYFIEVGSRSSQGSSATFLISKIDEAIELKSPKVIIESGDQGQWTGFYDSNGGISWNVLNEIVGRFGPPSLIFEAPLVRQRSYLILEFGPHVNLASVPIGETMTLEMQRLGLTAETLGLSPSVQSVEGSPASKFVYFLIKSEHPIDQATLAQKSGLPKRTLQAALGYLVQKGLAREIPDMSDLRKHKYTLR